MHEHQKIINNNVEKTISTLAVLYSRLLTSPHTNNKDLISEIEDTVKHLALSSANIGFKKGMDAGYSIGYGFSQRRQAFAYGKKSKAFSQKLYL